MESFRALGLSERTLDALRTKGFSEPTPIQERTVPLILGAGTDVVGLAGTGTGKTAAFGLPLVELAEERAGCVQALVLCPTRELAVQVANEIESLRGAKRLNVLTVYGGQPFGPQLRGLRQGADVVVGTPGRVLDHMRRGSLDLSGLSFLVLDEADEMLDMGFVGDIEEVLENCPEDRRTLLFSATMSRDIMGIAKRFMSEHEVVSVGGDTAKPDIEQYFHEVPERSRFDALCRVIDCTDEFYGLVFCRTKADVDEVANRLGQRGYASEALHGDVSQAGREKILSAFRSGRVRVLVATDVAARGIDVADLTHVVNFALPQDPESYVHRVGRTGRAGKKGIAVTLICPREFGKLRWMMRAADVSLAKRQLPDGEQAASARRANVADQVRLTLEQDGYESCLTLADELLTDGAEPRDVLAAALRSAFGESLDPASYPDIAEPAQFEQASGGMKVNLFMAAGRNDGLTLPKLLDWLWSETGVRKNSVQGVKLFANHTLFHTPAREAEAILDKFGRKQEGKPPLIRKDKAPQGGYKNRYNKHRAA